MTKQTKRDMRKAKWAFVVRQITAHMRAMFPNVPISFPEKPTFTRTGLSGGVQIEVVASENTTVYFLYDFKHEGTLVLSGITILEIYEDGSTNISYSTDNGLEMKAKRIVIDEELRSTHRRLTSNENLRAHRLKDAIVACEIGEYESSIEQILDLIVPALLA